MKLRDITLYGAITLGSMFLTREAIAQGLEEKLKEQPKQEEVNEEQPKVLRAGKEIEGELKSDQEEARSVLLNPKKFIDKYKHRKGTASNLNSQIIIGQTGQQCLAEDLLNQAKGNNDFLKKIVEVYTQIDEELIYDEVITKAYIPSLAIEMMTKGDDDYFKKIYEKSCSKEYSRCFFSNSFYISDRALNKVQDLEYVKIVIAKAAKGKGRAATPEGSWLCRRGQELYSIDPQFIDDLARNAEVLDIRVGAIGSTSNKEILQMYADLTDEQCNEEQYAPNSEQAVQAANNDDYRYMARIRLAKLDKKN